MTPIHLIMTFFLFLTVTVSIDKCLLSSLQQNNPIIAVMINDGTKLYDHQNDGNAQIQGSCIRDFRNKPFPIQMKIEYVNQVLTVRHMLQGYSLKRNQFAFVRSTSTTAFHKMRMLLNFAPESNE
jgi:hypothetical protein